MCTDNVNQYLRTVTVLGGTFTRVIIDGVVPILGTNQRGTWATQLLTMGETSQIFRIGFQFQNQVMLHVSLLRTLVDLLME